MSLQEGNRVMQEQINLLNRELREAKKEFDQKLQAAREMGDRRVANRQQRAARISELERANRKLTGQTQWLRKQRAQFRKAFHVENKGAKTKIFPQSLPTVAKATTQALSQHGYVMMARMVTDQKAVYVTEQKRALPPSLELQGFRNQYLVVLEKMGQDQTKLSVKADFERVAGGGRVLEARLEEITEIELRLIQKIEQALKHPEKA
ncbi:MAG: hypothetical protein IH977_10335 [Nitrospinae bacterium]|nr:hypothetical protein [Nitrospinota bacterium]